MPDRHSMTPEFANFLLWEKSSRDSIDFKKIYVDMAGDVLAGLMLSEIVYWYLPSVTGDTKLRQYKDETFWIVCSRTEWWDRIRLGKRETDRALKILESRNLIVRSVHLFNGKRALHIRLNEEVFILLWNALVNDPMPNPYTGRIPHWDAVEKSAKKSSKLPNGDLQGGSKSRIGDLQNGSKSPNGDLVDEQIPKTVTSLHRLHQDHRLTEQKDSKTKDQIAATKSVAGDLSGGGQKAATPSLVVQGQVDGAAATPSVPNPPNPPLPPDAKIPPTPPVDERLLTDGAWRVAICDARGISLASGNSYGLVGKFINFFKGKTAADNGKWFKHQISFEGIVVTPAMIVGFKLWYKSHYTKAYYELHELIPSTLETIHDRFEEFVTSESFARSVERGEESLRQLLGIATAEVSEEQMADPAEVEELLVGIVGQDIVDKWKAETGT